jgi:hypothetical protein
MFTCSVNEVSATHWPAIQFTALWQSVQYCGIECPSVRLATEHDPYGCNGPGAGGHLHGRPQGMAPAQGRRTAEMKAATVIIQGLSCSGGMPRPVSDRLGGPTQWAVSRSLGRSRKRGFGTSRQRPAWPWSGPLPVAHPASACLCSTRSVLNECGLNYFDSVTPIYNISTALTECNGRSSTDELAPAMADWP